MALLITLLKLDLKLTLKKSFSKKNFPYTMKKNKMSFNHSVRGTWGVFWPSFIVVTKPSAEMKRKAQNVTTLPHPGSTLTSNSRKITALQQDKNVTNKVGIILCLAWHSHFCLMFTLFWQTSISREKLINRYHHNTRHQTAVQLLSCEISLSEKNSWNFVDIQATFFFCTHFILTRKRRKFGREKLWVIYFICWVESADV